jgi:hypothetical protein
MLRGLGGCGPKKTGAGLCWLACCRPLRRWIAGARHNFT